MIILLNIDLSQVMSNPSQKGYNFEKKIVDILKGKGYEVEWRWGEYLVELLLYLLGVKYRGIESASRPRSVNYYIVV